MVSMMVYMSETTRNCSLLRDERSAADACSIVRIIENEVSIFGIRLYNTINPDFDYSKGTITFFVQRNGDEHSLNQSVDGSPKRLSVPYNIGVEIIHAMQELDKENERRIESLLASEHDKGMVPKGSHRQPRRSSKLLRSDASAANGKGSLDEIRSKKP